MLRALEKAELETMLKDVVLYCIVSQNLRVQTADLVGLLVGVEVLHYGRCGRGWRLEVVSVELFRRVL